MRKYAPLAFSFLLGGLFVLGIQTSTVVQRLFAQTPVANCPTGPITPIELTRKFGKVLIASNGAKPAVPTLWSSLSGNNSGEVAQLDGLNCDGCTLRVNLLTYAGGQFKCTNCSIASANGIYLEGAALNTLRVLQFVNAIPGAPAKPKTAPIDPNTPHIETAALSSPTRMDWISLSR